MALKLQEKNILVIDDEPELLDLVKDYLEGEYYNVYTATNGPDGIWLASKLTIHFILLDIAMPKMNGIEVLTELKKNEKTSSIPVMMLTGRLDTSLIVEAIRLGAHDYVTKPFKTDDLLKWIKVHERYEPKKDS